MKIIDFNDCPFSIKNGTYGGNAGGKNGIVYDGRNWMLKYPKYIKNMDKVDVSYSTSPLSEYLGSSIYKILGYDVHNVLLGERNSKIVVACEDFETENKKLLEMRTIKNNVNKTLSEELDMVYDEIENAHVVDLSVLMLHFKHNSIINSIPGLEERFWDQAVIDILINNNDRNNGNWGILRNTFTGQDEIAPVFDNGGSFHDKLSEEKIARLLENKELVMKNACNTQSVFGHGGHFYSVSNFLALANQYKGLHDAILKVVPEMKCNFAEIEQLFQEIPVTYRTKDGQELLVCSEQRKELFLYQMHSRLTNLLYPAYEKEKG